MNTTNPPTTTMDIRTFFNTKTPQDTHCVCGHEVRHSNDICGHGYADGICCVCKECREESDPEMATLVKALKELGTTTARKLAKHAGMEKHRVNQLLYGTPATFCEAGKDGVAPLWTLVDESDEGNTCERCETKGDDVGDCDGHILCPECVDNYNATFSYEGRTWCDECDETHAEGDECHPKKRYVLPK